MALLANIHKDPRRSSQPVSPDTFNPWVMRRNSKPLVKLPIKALKGLFVRDPGKKGA